ncbi:MAG: alpha/beta hydrolase [Deltaproteobacteria bacterium]|jgi:3-oxoadipate enol-lactonase|nr:alpha/beta hydrolase [Deltaproteobacteria bacterium]
MPFATIRGIRMYYERAGSGRPVLFLNGSQGDLRMRPGPFEGPVGQHFDLLAHDQRGLGQTEKPEHAYSMADYAEDAAALLDHVGWESCAVMGVSFGGMVAQELAVRHPKRIERLVLCCTSSGGRGSPSYPLHELQELSDEERLLRSLELSDRRMDADWRKSNPEAFARVREMMAKRGAVGAGEPGREMGARHQLEARRHHDVYDRLPKATMPTLVCAGRYDGIAPLANSEAIASQLPDATLEVFEGGHLFLVQDPRAHECIVGFLGEDGA